MLWNDVKCVVFLLFIYIYCVYVTFSVESNDKVSLKIKKRDISEISFVREGYKNTGLTVVFALKSENLKM